MAAIADVEVPSSKPAMGIILASTNGQDGPEGILGRGELEGPARHWRRPTRSNHERESI
ncbi:MAG: hypothetical protein WA813_21370 [Beijerinckiaceae bacterium]